MQGFEMSMCSTQLFHILLKVGIDIYVTKFLVREWKVFQMNSIPNV